MKIYIHLYVFVKTLPSQYRQQSYYWLYLCDMQLIPQHVLP